MGNIFIIQNKELIRELMYYEVLNGTTKKDKDIKLNIKYKNEP